MADSDLPTGREIIATHDRVEEHWNLKFTGASVAAPRLKFERILDDIENVNGVYPRAAHLLRDITTAHYFEDGNKRTAWLTTRAYLENNDKTPSETGKQAEKIMRRIREFDYNELAEWLETGDIDDTRLPE